MVFIINKQNSFQEFQSLSYQTKTLFIFKFNSSDFLMVQIANAVRKYL